MSGFVFPNEVKVEWDLLITIYPYITGLVAGAFVVSSLYHVFGVKSLRPVARFSLVSALAFLLVAPMPLLFHLGRPERALEMFLTPNFTSAMSGFGFIWLGYLLLVMGEVWLVFRQDIVKYANSSEGYKKALYTLLALGVVDADQASFDLDKKLIKILAFLGIPVAFLLHGYVGFIFGAIKANPWWSTPLMPIIFLASAIVSGIALLIVLYILICKFRKVPIDQKCVRSLVFWLGGFLSLNVLFEGLEVFSMLYESEESWAIIRQLITEKISISYFGLQFFMGAIVPVFILAVVALVSMKDFYRTLLSFVASAFVLIGVFAMRWNVVIGGQIISKSLRGFNSYTPPLLGEGGLVVAAIFMALPFLIIAVVSYYLPPWQDEVKVTEQRILGFRKFSRS